MKWLFIPISLTYLPQLIKTMPFMCSNLIKITNDLFFEFIFSFIFWLINSILKFKINVNKNYIIFCYKLSYTNSIKKVKLNLNAKERAFQCSKIKDKVNLSPFSWMDGSKIKFFETTHTDSTKVNKKSWSISLNNDVTPEISSFYFKRIKVTSTIFLLTITKKFIERLETFSLKHNWP